MTHGYHFHSTLSDADGILAFAMLREGWDHPRIARALRHHPADVAAFFQAYWRRPWPRALSVPPHFTPDAIRSAVRVAA